MLSGTRALVPYGAGQERGLCFQRCEAFADGILGKLGHGVNIEFVHYLATMGLHSLGTDMEFQSDLLR